MKHSTGKEVPTLQSALQRHILPTTYYEHVKFMAQIFTQIAVSRNPCMVITYTKVQQYNQPTRCNNDFINNYNQLNMFREIISPILSSTRLCLQLVV